MGYAIRLPANRVLQDKIGYLLKRPVGRPPQEVRRYYASFRYQAGSWTKPRRVVAKIEWHPGELYPRVGFIVTNLARPAERLVAFYNHRGTPPVMPILRRQRRPPPLAYNLGNFMRTLAMPKTAEPWSLTSLREKLVKIGAKVVSHGRYVDLPDGRGRGVATDVRRHPVADHPAAGTARAGMTRQPSAPGNEGRGMPWSSKAARFSVGPPSTTSFDGPLLAATAICHCPSRSEARSWPRNGRESGECRLKALA